MNKNITKYITLTEELHERILDDRYSCFSKEQIQAQFLLDKELSASDLEIIRGYLNTIFGIRL
jgi:hypothetical protein